MPKSKKSLSVVPDAPEQFTEAEVRAPETLEDIEPAPAPKKLGRPSKYREEYCEDLISHMRTGLSFESFAGRIGVNQDTIHEWVKVHPDFSEAKKVAWSANLLTWEKMGVQGTMGMLKGFNVASWIFNMKNRHRWNDGQQEREDNPMDSLQELFRQANEELDRKLAG